MKITAMKFSIMAMTAIAIMLILFPSCSDTDNTDAQFIENRDSLPVLKSNGVSTLISDSGIIQYKLIAEEWYIYDKKDPQYWAFEKGLFIEKFDKDFNVEAFISSDTAYYYNKKRLWELRGRVYVKNLKGETFRTSLLFWDETSKSIYSKKYMEIDGLEQKLSGYDFKSNEQMTEYRIHDSSGAFPVSDEVN